MKTSQPPILFSFSEYSNLSYLISFDCILYWLRFYLCLQSYSVIHATGMHCVCVIHGSVVTTSSCNHRCHDVTGSMWPALPACDCVSLPGQASWYCDPNQIICAMLQRILWYAGLLIMQYENMWSCWVLFAPWTRLHDHFFVHKVLHHGTFQPLYTSPARFIQWLQCWFPMLQDLLTSMLCLYGLALASCTCFTLCSHSFTRVPVSVCCSETDTMVLETHVSVAFYLSCHVIKRIIKHICSSKVCSALPNTVNRKYALSIPLVLTYQRETQLLCLVF